MTRQQSFKSRVRDRMGKTGERYTTARKRLLDKSAPPPPQPPAPEGMQAKFSEDALIEKTGRGWNEWFGILDEWGGARRTHTAIAKWLVADQGVDGWWSQTITVGYEQARGMRAPGQLSDGTYSATGSKTVAVPIERLFEAFADDAIRALWLPDANVRIRATTPPKSVRADWLADSTRIVAGFGAKGEAKSQVGIIHERLPDAQAAATLKAYWRERLAVLKQVLES
jgi:hypothetical protein